MKFGFRVDGSTKLGMGNLTRCVALAKNLNSMGFDSIFLTKNNPEALLLLQKNNFNTFLLPKNIPNSNLAKTIKTILNKEKVNIVVNDIKDTQSNYIKNLRKNHFIIVNFDDLGSGRYHADYLFDAFYGSDDKENKKHHFGPKFVILRPEFQKYAGIPKIIQKKAKTLSVMMGSSNTGGYLRDILQIIRSNNHIDICHVILSNSMNNAEIFQLDFPDKVFNFHYHPQNIANILNESDLAITSGGISMCECCALGVPTLVVPQVKHEQQNSDLFESQGAVITMPVFEPTLNKEHFKNRLNYLLQNSSLRRKLSKNGQFTVDGQGLNRIIAKITTQNAA